MPAKKEKEKADGRDVKRKPDAVPEKSSKSLTSKKETKPAKAAVTKRKKTELGLIHVYDGDGKGKTTAALGLALRAIGHGFRVSVVQFMKGGRFFGELLAAEKYFPRKMEFAQFGQSTQHEKQIARGELKPSKTIFLPFEDEKEQMHKAFKYTEKIIKSGKYDLVILDEINNAMRMKLIDEEDVLKLLLSKPKNVEIVLTGRNPPKEIMTIADYFVRYKSVKHPFDGKKRTIGRRGIEY